MCFNISESAANIIKLVVHHAVRYKAVFYAEYKISELRSFGKREIIDTRLTVKPGAFVIGKETRDILWPTSCQILNIKSRHGAHAVKGINEGDVLHVQFTTHDFEQTERELCALVGEQKVHRNYSDDMRRGF